MKPSCTRSIALVAALMLLVPPARAQFYSEQPIPAPSGHPIAVNLYRGPSDSICWIAVADSLLSSGFDLETHKTVLYVGSGSPNAPPGTSVVLDSTQRQVSYWAGSEFDLYNCAAATGPGGGVAVAWAWQRFYASDIIYPRMLRSPELQCAIRRADTIDRICRIRNADHPSAIMGDQGLVHLVFESVAPFSSSALLYPAYDTSYYFVTSRLQYRVLHQNGEMDSLADYPGGFRPELHRDRSGLYHLFWLEGDSSNCPVFRLMYSRNPGTSGTTTMVAYPSVPAMEEYDLNRCPPSYASFVDDSGRASVGWTDTGNSLDGRIYFARLLPGGTWEVDTLGGQSLLEYRAVFQVDRSGRAHVLWQTYDGSAGWTLHYSSSSPSEHLFSQQRTFQSPYAYAGSPVIIVDSRGVANAVFSDGSAGIGYLRNLASGPDTIIHVSPGSSIAKGIDGSPPSFPAKTHAVVDSTDQIWLARSNNGIALLKFDRTLTGHDDIIMNLPKRVSMNQNFPNPFNPTTVISYQVPAASDVTLVVYDLLGREVTTLVNERKQPGSYDVKFDALGRASGVYLYRLTAGNSVQTRKMLLLQ